MWKCGYEVMASLKGGVELCWQRNSFTKDRRWYTTRQIKKLQRFVVLHFATLFISLSFVLPDGAVLSKMHKKRVGKVTQCVPKCCSIAFFLIGRLHKWFFLTSGKQLLRGGFQGFQITGSHMVWLGHAAARPRILFATPWKFPNRKRNQISSHWSCVFRHQHNVSQIIPPFAETESCLLFIKLLASCPALAYNEWFCFETSPKTGPGVRDTETLSIIVRQWWAWI